MFTHVFHHKSRLELKHVTAVGNLVETAISLHLNFTARELERQTTY